MNPSEDEPSSGLNGRLRPRKSTIPSPQSNKPISRKLEGKLTQEKPKRSTTPSKASPSKPDDLSTKPNSPPTPQLLCPYCDRIFVSKQTASKHVRRSHLSTSKLEPSMGCLFCNHFEREPFDIIRHMVDCHPNQYFACLDCNTRFPSTKELAEHKLNICEKQKIPYRSKLRRKSPKKSQKSHDTNDKDDFRNNKNFTGHGFNGIVISCELKPSHIPNEADIEDNITTNLILPPGKNITATGGVLDKNAVIVLDDIQWNRRIPSNFSFHNTDADQILSRLGVVHRSPKTGEPTKKDWFRVIEDATQKFEKCFDTSFYSKVASNVQENLTKFLDGSFNFNPDPDSTIKTRKSKNSVVINTAEGFPILLACEQFSRNIFDGYMPRTIAPKHKWKWDSVDNEKQWNPDQIKRDTHANNCIITLVSRLDIWTQLCMRRKFEDKYNTTPIEKKTAKKNVIGKELKEILESREIPSANKQIVRHVKPAVPITNERDFPTSLGLMPAAPNFHIKPAVLSGEWVRPRCYVCCACGAQSRDSRALSMHVSTQHPNAQVQHYEIVGESLLKADILKHLYVPPSQNVNRTRPPRGFRDCTKCNMSVTNDDLHQHMLDCAGDTPAVRRKCRHRPFGVRRRRPRLPDNRIRKKMRSDIRTRTSRQKNRMRTKPRIRTEVGDAETIRKMLADLPAKRHRVLVNPLNSILRPRRKLDKQRAMLMMKRRTSDDLKGGKPRPSNHSMHFDHSTNSDRSKNILNRDDEDNKPLKPRMKRVACKIARQKECLNRKIMLNKPKRKLRPIIEKKNNENDEKVLDNSTSCSEKTHTDELSIDRNEKRVNLNSDPQNVRENSSGRGSSNNGWRDNQRPGCSGQNDNSRNVCAPAQNVPLKHSIARLTANSETHDKSVQFHHLFLVQQECNNVNQHVPSGQRLLFENEAVVTKLDKPPLHFNQYASIEQGHIHGHTLELLQGQSLESLQGQVIESVQEQSLESIQGQSFESVQGQTLESIQGQTLDSIQKNKLNKSRKGLNDCIAMLKNKLVDVNPNAPAHVSVQCGTDDILPQNSDLVIKPTVILQNQTHNVSMKPVQAYPCTERPKKASPKNNEQSEFLHKPAALYQAQHLNQGTHSSVNIEKKVTQWRPVNYDAIVPKFIDIPIRKEVSRRRSLSQTENILLAQQILSASPHKHDILMRLSTESYDTYNLKPKPQKNARSRQRNSKPVPRQDLSKGKITDIQIAPSPKRPSDACVRNMHTEKLKKSGDPYEKKIKSRMDPSRKSIDSFDKKLPIRKDVPNTTTESIEIYRNKTLDIQPQREFTVKTLEEGKNLNTHQPIRKQIPSNLKTGVNLTQYKQFEPQPVLDINVQMPINAFTEHNFNDTVIPFAHASTHSELNLSVPLDLSGKASSLHSNYSSRRDSVTLANYGDYETLDLSKKSVTTVDHLACEDVVVDLRVKHNSQDSCLTGVKTSSLNLSGESSQHDMSMVTPVNLTQYNECFPTDLSLKRTVTEENICINLSKKGNDLQIHDLSKNKTKANDPVGYVLNAQDSLPTDLSNKKRINYTSPQVITEESHVDENQSCNQPNNNDTSDEVPEKVNNEDNARLKTITEKLTTDEIVVTDASNLTDNENINKVDDTTHMSPASKSSVTHNQKPIYDPTLRIPQFKIRPAASESTSRESNFTEAHFSLETSISIDFPPQEIPIYSAHASHRNTITRTNYSPFLASITAQERITYSFTNAAINAAVSMAGSFPVYTLLNPSPITTFESTRAVYTLPNACISVTKMDGNRSTTLTNTLLSIPSTTMMSTAPVYTLAGTTIGTSLNYVTLPNTGQSIPSRLACGTYLPEISSHTMTHHTLSSNNTMQELRAHDDHTILRNAIYTFEQDDEITRRLLMLPKEIRGVLGTMPNGLRSQLLDILPLYFSGSRPIPIPLLTAQASLFKSLIPTATSNSLPIRLSRELTVDASTDTVDIKPLYKQRKEDECNVKRLQCNVSLNSVSPNESYSGKLGLCNEVIDLTDDDIVPKIDTESITDDGSSKTVSVQEIPFIPPKPNLPKSNNDKTASLRAVRIKAPSERQKSKLMINQSGNVPSPAKISVPGKENNDNAITTTLDSTDIQLLEAGSTQSNKNRLMTSQLLPTVTSLTNIQIQTTRDSNNALSNSINKEPSEKNESQISEQIPIDAISSDHSVICSSINDTLVATELIKENVKNEPKNVLDSNLNEVNKLNHLAAVSNKKEKSLATLKLNKNIDDDDSSEDDISLAVIVKHKLQNINKLKSASQCDFDATKCKTKSKSKQKNKIINNHTDKSTCLGTSGNKKTSQIFIEENATSKVVTNTIKNKRSMSISSKNCTGLHVKKRQLKKKAQKSRAVSLKAEKVIDAKNGKEIQTDEHENYLDDEEDKMLKGIRNMENKDIEVKIMTEHDNISLEIITDLSNMNDKIQEQQETSPIKIPEVTEKNQNELDDKIMDEFGHDKNKNVKPVHESQYNVQGDIYKCNKIESTTVSNDLLVTQNNNINEKDSCRSFEPTIRLNNVVVSAKLNDDIKNNTELTAITSENDIGLPLRRSRRGKSLFVDGKDQDILNTDTLLEHKTPLPKKQLIFSKLLLDEENYIKTKCTPIDNNHIQSEHDRPFANIGNDSPIHQSTCQSESSVIEEKNRSVKRKKSPLPKNMSKKKKSVDSIPSTEESDDGAQANVEINLECNVDNNSIAVDVSEEQNRSSVCTKDISTLNIFKSQTILDDDNNELDTDELQTNKTELGNSSKRKIELSINNLPDISSSKPKKLRLDTIDTSFETTPSVKTDSEEVKKIVKNAPVAARRTRSKSVVVKSSGSMLYDPYDIELEDMADITEPFRKQRLSLLKTSNSKPTKDSTFNINTVNNAITEVIPTINVNVSETTTAVKCKENLSDSDESSKSDEPLKKYAERKNAQLMETSNAKDRPDVDVNSDSNSTGVKQNRKKHKKSKRTLAATENIQKIDKDLLEESEKQLRSEQFMESFGFFSERKPRKSNLLATKKISETFHIIANESDDMYTESKERSSKKSSRGENRKYENKDLKDVNSAKLSEKSNLIENDDVILRYCYICKKEFRRMDNLLRHQMTLLHISKLAEFEMKLKTTPVPDEPNYLVVFKQHMDRLKVLENKIKSKKQSKQKFTLPPLQEILAEVHKTVREQQLARRSLSRDEALFLDCCELLKESNGGQIGNRNINRPFVTCCAKSYALACTSADEMKARIKACRKANGIKMYQKPPGSPKRPFIHTSAHLSGMANFVLVPKSKKTSNTDLYAQPSTSTAKPTYTFDSYAHGSSMDISDRNADDNNDSGDVDSITAHNILNSEEVRNLENDLLSGLKQAACKFQPLLNEAMNDSKSTQDDLTEPTGSAESYNVQVDIEKSAEKAVTPKVKAITEIKEMKNLDIIESIDIFEDKFDKIKRKCRSQAAAAKQVQAVVEPIVSHKPRKRTEKKKSKKVSKKHNQSTVLTKGALKGYDSIKVSILTSDIDMSAIVPSITASSKRKKKGSSKKKRDRKRAVVPQKGELNGVKEPAQKNVDVYEFMDTEEPEIFELRPSTVMERFKNLNNREFQSGSKIEPVREAVESNDSASDGDDFVYMSDDYVGSEDETENSLMSCELGNVKGSSDTKKSFSPLKRKDVMEKNAVMGKIFKHNAVRSGKKNLKSKESTKPRTADLDQLFDSLLEEEPTSSMLVDTAESPKREDSYTAQKKRVFSPVELSKYDLKTTKNDFRSKKIRSPSPALSSDSAVSKRISPFSSTQSSPRGLSPNRYDTASPIDYGPSTSRKYHEPKKYDKDPRDYHHRSLERKYDEKRKNATTASRSVLVDDDFDLSPNDDDDYDTYPKAKTSHGKSSSRKRERATGFVHGFDNPDDYDQDALSEDAGVARQRARRKCTVGKQNILAETWSSESEPDGVPPRPNSAESVVLSAARKRKGKKKEGQACGARKGNRHVSAKKQDIESRVTSSNRNIGGGGGAYSPLSLPGPSGLGSRARPGTSYWADDDEEPEHVQQHGWIVGDSHKKLVTMLAHAKGRKRNNDDKRHMME